MFGYLSLIPFALERPLLVTAVPSLILYVTLDGLIVLKLIWAARAAQGGRWRGLYLCLLATAALWLATDALELLMYVEIVPYRGYGHVSDLVWWLPYLPLLAAARLREPPFAGAAVERPEPASQPPGEGLWGDPLVAYAAAFPVMHFVLHGVNALDPVTRPVREAFALIVLAVIGGLAVGYQKLLLAENRRLGELRLRAAQAEHRAYHDALTGLPNRYLLFDRLAGALNRAQRASKQLALLFLDLDRFKLVNDSLGHSAGDRLLTEVAQRLQRQLRKTDTLARLGGDEFTVVLEAVRPEDAVKVAFKLRQALREPMVLDGRDLYVTGSIGIALYPEDGADAETLLKSSDVAMYRAKQLGGDGHQLFAAEMNERAQANLAIESQLRKGLASDQFALQYQPVLQLAQGRVIGFEALLRWHHPERGLLTAGEFIEVAELTGVAMELSPWILRTACRQLQLWNKGGAKLVLSVNLSARQFLDTELARRIQDVLMETGLDPERLELEVTEGVAMQNSELTATTLHALRAIGLRLSIDDFGTGYSSLSYLRQFPIDTLKLDRSFVSGIDRDPNAAAIAATILAMGRTLGLRVVAEGVESEAQLKVLRELGCECAQGYLLGRPAWPDQVALPSAPPPD
jgi:diguanylate cyclase (GGDEF)-like protein